MAGLPRLLRLHDTTVQEPLIVDPISFFKKKIKLEKREFLFINSSGTNAHFTTVA